MPARITRRRFVRITAAAAGLGLLPSGHPARASAPSITWRGTMLGAVATMEIHHDDRSEAERLISLASGEARRLERLFSLYQKDSALVELNRTGILVDPAAEMTDLLSTAQHYSKLTDGVFDVTVQCSHYGISTPATSRTKTRIPRGRPVARWSRRSAASDTLVYPSAATASPCRAAWR